MTTDDEVRWVTDIVPYDITVARDPSIQALVMLAVSLGWNAHHKNGQPIVLTARNGMQKRLPTNTSVRMSVFQTALSTIILYTEEDVVPTIELIDRIIAITKPSKEHERRLRLAVGETPAHHRERLAAAAAESQGAREPQPVTTRIEIPEEAWSSEETMLDDMMVPVAARAAPAPFDGKDHGKLVSREPFVAAFNRKRNSSSYYVSDTSYERHWEDGLVDYECMYCGEAFSTSKGVGSHRQRHIQAGEIEATETRPWKRSTGIMHGPPRTPPGHRRTSEEKAAEVIPSVLDLTFEDPPPEDETVDVYLIEEEENLELSEEAIMPLGYADIVGKIAELILPNQIKRWEAQIAELRAENDALRDDLAHMEGDFEALIDLMESRRKKS